MSEYYRTKGFVFKKDPSAESDVAFSIFTEDFGKIKLTGKAIRKIASKLKSGIDVFYFSEVEFIQGKNKKTLIDASSINKFSSLNKNLKNLYVANKISFVLDSFIKGEEKDERLFKLLKEIFEEIGDKDKTFVNFELAFQYFFWNFLLTQGYGFKAENCAICKGELDQYNIYFSIKDGGITCKNCLAQTNKAIKIDSNAAKILRIIFKKDIETLSRLKITLDSQKILEDISQSCLLEFCPA